MSILERLALPIFRSMDPETAHKLGLKALNLGLLRLPGPITNDRLSTQIAGLELPNPVGLAAGFDKNAQAIAPLSLAGFGFLEVGAATPLPQPGNPKPRLFRLSEDYAAINRFGFNNHGMDKIYTRLSRRQGLGIPVGLNLGANKDSDDRAADYVKVLKHCASVIDFATVNVSSPNTEKLRDLQGPEALSALLANVIAAKSDLPRPIPVFLKIAPDLSAEEIGEIAEVAIAQKIDAIIATNTTIDRANLKSAHQSQTGGLSGTPLFEKSTQVLAKLFSVTGGKIPLIGVGGISSAEDAYTKICAGASAVQFYTAMVYQGMSFARNVVKGLDEQLKADGYSNSSEAVGTKSSDWV